MFHYVALVKAVLVADYGQISVLGLQRFHLAFILLLYNINCQVTCVKIHNHLTYELNIGSKLG